MEILLVERQLMTNLPFLQIAKNLFVYAKELRDQIYGAFSAINNGLKVPQLWS